MFEFKSNRPIYIQIKEYCYARVLTGEWLPGTKMPSVRELAVTMSVNVNTILKAYEGLESEGIIYTRRGLGFFLADDAHRRVRAIEREEFFNSTLPELFATMSRLDISMQEITERYAKNEI